ncbi:hypothetical protein BVC80_1037g34 [Macleaya cordata]|uniref:Uncharacterized protein n=1 Tax=Macleaya cordata TaxID=56857 RepID=A0A200QVJ9_MACCD|nr:hypothetical protein BVC80_1037g34 [Macleaya cordata]
MPKRKSRKSIRLPRSRLDEEEDSSTRNPKMTEQEEEEPNLKNQNPKLTEEEEEDANLENQNPEMIEEEANLQNQNPETIEEDKEEKNGDEDLQIQNPKKILEVEALTEDSNSIHGESQSLIPKMIEEDQQPQQSETLDQDQDLRSEDHQKEQQENKQELEEPEGMAMSPDSLSNFPPAYDMPMPDFNPEKSVSPKGDDQQPEVFPVSPTVHPPTAQDSSVRDLALENPPPTAPKKAPYRKKPLNKKQRAVLEKKLLQVKQNLQPIPFVPTRTLDFSKHEKLFKSLGLWDFAHIEFDREIRFDLLALLIANYNSSSRSSSVNDYRIMVNRADLARALKLPMKKDRINPLEAIDFDNEVLSEESISFIEEFVSNWILLHEDIWAMPNEVLTWTRYIKEGQPQKVDWPGLIWFMVEKELVQGPQLKSCYYASHLQYLMRSQRVDLFREETRVEVLTDEGEDNVDTKMKSLEDFQGNELENQHIELTLGQDRNESEQQDRDEDVMDFEECKEPGGSSQWLLDGKNNIGQHFLRRCNSNKVDILEDQCEDKEEEEQEQEHEQEEERFDLSSKCATLERLASTDLLQAMGTTSIPFSPSIQLLDNNSTGELLQTRLNNNINLGGPSMFGNACKRELSHEDDVRQHSFNDHNKRMRNTWDQKGSDFDMCIEHINSWMGKAKMMYEEKEDAFMAAQMNQEYLMSELQQRDSFIANLQRTKCEEVQKRDMEIYKLDHELRMMSKLLEGYRTALKETRQVFSDYRKRCPEPEEPFYKDVPGSGGLVLSVMALEKQRLEREEEEKIQRCFFEEKIKDFELGWFDKLESQGRGIASASPKTFHFDFVIPCNCCRDSCLI